MIKNKFANVVTSVETCVEFYESQRKVRNKILATKSTKRPCTARRTMSVQKAMYAIFFSTQGPPIQIAALKGRCVTGKFYHDKVLSNSYTMCCPPVRGDNPRALASGLSYVQVDKHGITILYHPRQCTPCTSRDISI